MTEKDSVDEMVERELKVFPDLDPQTEAAVNRISKIGKFLKRNFEVMSQRHGINQGEAHVLIKVRRADGGASPGYLAESLMVSTGAMTNRLDRLEESGLVRRDPDPDDRRATIVRLTERGDGLLDTFISEIGKKERDRLSVLSRAELKQLNDLLRKIVLSFERE
jgi:DNA-binding MarR family transcriptional regulator